MNSSLPPTASRSALMRWVFSVIRPYGGSLLIATGLAGLISLCRGTLVFVTRDLLDEVLASSRPGLLWLLPVGLICLFAVQGAARIGRTWLTRRASLLAERSLRSQLFQRLITLRPSRLSEAGLGDALSRLTHDAGKIRTAVGAAVTAMQRPLTALAVAAAAVSMAPRLALWAAVGLPLVALVIVVTGRLTRSASREQHSQLGALTAEARDALEGVRTIQAFGSEGLSQAAFDRVSGDEIRAGLRTSLFRMGGPPAVEFAAAIGVACVLGLGAQQVQSGLLTTGELVAFLLALGLLSEPLKGLSVAAGLWEEARGGLERVYEVLVLEEAAGRVRLPTASDPPTQPLHLELRGLRAERGEREVLKGIDITLGPGDRIVVRGASGAGKSTLLDCIAGFAEPSGGRLLWSGRDAAEFSLSARRSLIALVDQRPWIGRGTVADAIRIGQADADVDAVRQAAHGAGLKLDLDRRIGDGATAVSGGERQRIALARALLRDAPLLLLDEPCSNLDLQAEEEFLQHLVAASRDRAVLIVTHRPAALRHATQTYDLEAGRLVPAGPALKALA